jgi:hypothetical protein
VIAGCVTFAGCWKRVPVFGPEGEIKDAALLVQLARERASRVRAARGDAKAGAQGPRGSGSAQYLFALERPARLRVDVLSFFGQPLASLACDGERFALYDLGKQTFFRGPATAQNLARLFGVAATPEEWVRALLGDPPVIEGSAEITGVDAEGYRVTVRGADADAVQQLRIDTRDLRFLESARGGLRIAYAGWPDAPGPALPRRVTLDDGTTRLELETGAAQADPELAADVFTISPPEGAQLVELGD